MPTFSTVRAAGVMAGIGVAFVTLVGRVAYLQTYGRETTIARAERQQHQNMKLTARRGGVFDRNGILMAGTVQTKSLFIDPKFMQEQYQTEGHSLVEMDDQVAKLAKLIDKEPFALSQMLGDRADYRFVKVADNLDDDTCTAIAALDMPGVGVVPVNQRRYPMGSLAAHILGGVGADGTGLDGIELKFDKLLAGKDGFERLTKDARRRPIGVAAEDYVPPQHGQHLVLTIDSTIQLYTEQCLADTVQKYSAKRGEAVVIDPKTGEILALANYPTFDPGAPGEAPAANRLDSCLTSPYEPGSTFKPFIASYALMWHVTTMDEVWPLPGGLNWHTPYGRRISDVHGYGPLTTWDVLVKSSNIGMSMLGERMGNSKLYAAVTNYQFGKPTGIELPAENGGKVRALSKWGRQSTESVATGYEIMITPLQLARAFCTVINGGKLVTPRIVQGTLDPNGNVMSKTPPPAFDSLPQVLDPAVSLAMRRTLSDVVIRGTAKGARSRIWNIAGKTGTSHISEGKSGYSQTRYNSSFVACAPAEDPRLVVAFIIHEPDKAKAHFGGAVASPGASKLIEKSLAYLEVPSSPELPQPPASIAGKLWEFKPEQLSNRSFGATVAETE
jgi:cell division protein FtsI/penicillin-binding protein 2